MAQFIDLTQLVSNTANTLRSVGILAILVLTAIVFGYLFVGIKSRLSAYQPEVRERAQGGSNFIDESLAVAKRELARKGRF